MTPEPVDLGSARSADVLNEQIRALWQRAGGRLTTAEQRAAYEELLIQWTRAVNAERGPPARVEIVEAA